MNESPLESQSTRLTRRRFMGLTGGGLIAGAVIAACGGGDDDEQPPAAPSPASSNGRTQAQAAQKGTVVVGDVLDHALTSDKWPGQFGFVTFKLHTGSVDDEPVYFIRTDASDQAFATAEKLVFVPRVANALKSGGRGLSAIYLFDGGVADQRAVLGSAPHKPDFSPAFRVHRVSFTGAARKLGSVTAIQAAARDGQVRVEQTDIIVNYPVVKWPGGELPVDDVKDAYLGKGQLLEPVDVMGEKVSSSCTLATRARVTSSQT